MGKNRSHGFEGWGKVPEYSNNSVSYFSSTPAINPDFTIQKNTGYNQTDMLQKIAIPISQKSDLA